MGLQAGKRLSLSFFFHLEECSFWVFVCLDLGLVSAPSLLLYFYSPIPLFQIIPLLSLALIWIRQRVCATATLIPLHGVYFQEEEKDLYFQGGVSREVRVQCAARVVQCAVTCTLLLSAHPYVSKVSSLRNQKFKVEWFYAKQVKFLFLLKFCIQTCRWERTILEDLGFDLS